MGKVLITIPDPESKGGVSNIYNSLQWKNEDEVEYFINSEKNRSGNIIYFLKMLFRFRKRIKDYDIIQLNPSFNKKAVLRDASLLILAKTLNKKVIIFFHGWDDDFEHRIAKNKFYSKYFKLIFKKADAFLLLGKVFQDKLSDFGISSNPVFFLPTIADDKYYDNAKFAKTSNNVTLLFIARFVPEKGIDIVLKAYQYLLTKPAGFQFELIMAGDGPELKKCKKIVEKQKLPNVTFTGYISGFDKDEWYKKADILFFPTYSEGLPCVIMEAMLYGLIIVTRPVGGIPDWVKNKVNGMVSESKNPKAFANGILSLLEQPDLFEAIRERNQKIAFENFTPQKVKERLQNIYNQLLL